MFYGPQMVTFFFVLSGFVMVNSHYNKLNETIICYYKLRFARIYPIYLIALFLMYCFFSNHQEFKGLLLSVFLLQSWFPPYPLTLNVPGWSLSVETFFYALFPIFLILYRKTNYFIILIIIVSITIFSQLLLSSLYDVKLDNGIYHDYLFYFPLNHLCSFLVGNFIGLTFLRYKISEIKLNRKTSTLISILGLYFIIYDLNHGCFFNYLFHMNIISTSVYTISFGIFLLLMLFSKNSILTYILNTRPFIILGNISYSIYIMQLVVLYCFIKLNMDVAHDKVIFLIYYLTLILVSCITYKFIEKPFKNLILKI